MLTDILELIILAIAGFLLALGFAVAALVPSREP